MQGGFERPVLLALLAPICFHAQPPQSSLFENRHVFRFDCGAVRLIATAYLQRQGIQVTERRTLAQSELLFLEAKQVRSANGKRLSARRVLDEYTTTVAADDRRGGQGGGWWYSPDRMQIEGVLELCGAGGGCNVSYTYSRHFSQLFLIFPFDDWTKAYSGNARLEAEHLADIATEVESRLAKPSSSGPRNINLSASYGICHL